uniref:Uncharacterized protein n=1 Tax=Romanomermis culicivorax TaxID=13658 RepID=A0A915JWG0_ROMCU
MRNGQLLFSIRGTMMFTKILIQGERSICCVNVNSHGDTNTKAAEKVDQNHFMQRTQGEKFDGRINAWWISGHHEGNAMPRIRGLEIRIIWQSGCFAGQWWLGIAIITGGCLNVVAGADVGAIGGSDMVWVTVVVVTGVVAVGGCDRRRIVHPVVFGKQHTGQQQRKMIRGKRCGQGVPLSS